MTRIVLVLSLALGALQSVPPQQPPTAPLAYDDYCKLERTEKRRVFKQSPPEHRARLARTQMERWRDANAARLKPEQLALLKEMIAAIGPAMYDGGTEADQAAARQLIDSLESRAETLLTREDSRALRYDAPCPPGR